MRGIYPPLLVDRGLRDALAWAPRSARIETTLDVDGSAPLRAGGGGRGLLLLPARPPERRQACRRHGARDVRVREADGDLVFDVRDDGAGFRPATLPSPAG